MKIATIGVHVLDTHVIGVESIPEGSDGALVERIHLSPAGTAGGTAVVLSRLGARVHSFGAVGTDALSDVLLAKLAEEGVDIDGLTRTAEHQTSASVIPVRPNGDRPAWHRIGANGAFTADALADVDFSAYTHVHLGGPEFLGGEAAGQVLARARTSGAVTSIDILAPGDPDMLAWIADALPHADYLLPNDEQVLGFTGASTLLEGARALLGTGVGCVAVTQGSKGAIVATRDETIEVPAFTIDAIDTTGCGDAFSAGFLRGLSLGHDLRRAAVLGCATAAHVAQGLGTDAGVYDLDTVEAFVQMPAG